MNPTQTAALYSFLATLSPKQAQVFRDITNSHRDNILAGLEEDRAEVECRDFIETLASAAMQAWAGEVAMPVPDRVSIARFLEREGQRFQAAAEEVRAASLEVAKIGRLASAGAALRTAALQVTRGDDRLEE